MEELDATRAEFDQLFVDARPPSGDWAFEKEAEFDFYTAGFAGVDVHFAECKHAFCRAELVFDTEEQAHQFFSRAERRERNPWKGGRMKAVRHDPHSMKRVTLYAIPDKERREPSPNHRW